LLPQNNFSERFIPHSLNEILLFLGVDEENI